MTTQHQQRVDDEFWNIVEDDAWESATTKEEMTIWLGLAVLVPVSINVWLFVFRVVL